MTSPAATIEEYLASLPEDRRDVVAKTHQAMMEALPEGYEAGMQYGMIGYYVPHSIYPAGYHCDKKQPLPFAGLGNQKGHVSLYLMCIYMNDELRQDFEQQWAQTGKKLDMGKSCIRFKRFEDLAVEVVQETVRRVTVEKYIARYEQNLKRR